jgi:hypothetical protein
MTATGINWSEVRQRVEQCVVTLTTRYVSPKFQPDPRLLSKAWSDCTPEAGGEGVIELAGRYGISLDWLLTGNVTGFICAGAAQAQEETPGSNPAA